MFKFIFFVIFSVPIVNSFIELIDDQFETDVEEHVDEFISDLSQDDTRTYLINQLGEAGAQVIPNLFRIFRKLLVKFVKKTVKNNKIRKTINAAHSIVRQEKLLTCFYDQIDVIRTTCISEENWFECSIFELKKNCGKLAGKTLLKLAQDLIIY